MMIRTFLMLVLILWSAMTTTTAHAAETQQATVTTATDPCADNEEGVTKWLNLNRRPLSRAGAASFGGIHDRMYVRLLSDNLSKFHDIPVAVRSAFLLDLASGRSEKFVDESVPYGFVFDGLMFQGKKPGEVTTWSQTRVCAVKPGTQLPVKRWSMEYDGKRYHLFIATACANLGWVDEDLLQPRAVATPPPQEPVFTVPTRREPPREPVAPAHKPEPRLPAAPPITDEPDEEQKLETARKNWEFSKLELITFGTAGTRIEPHPELGDAVNSGFEPYEGFVALRKSLRRIIWGAGVLEFELRGGVYYLHRRHQFDPKSPFYGAKALGHLGITFYTENFQLAGVAEYRKGLSNDNSEFLIRGRGRAFINIFEAELIAERSWRTDTYDLDVVGGNLRVGVNLMTLGMHRNWQWARKTNWSLLVGYFGRIENLKSSAPSMLRVKATPDPGGVIAELYNIKHHIFIEGVAERSRNRAWVYSPSEEREKLVVDMTTWEIRVSVGKVFKLF
jgi:hypothetical protein